MAKKNRWFGVDPFTLADCTQRRVVSEMAILLPLLKRVQFYSAVRTPRMGM